MITFYFENGCVATLRTSGTEPKIKYYTELACQPGDKYVYSAIDLIAVYKPKLYRLKPFVWVDPHVQQGLVSCGLNAIFRNSFPCKPFQFLNTASSLSGNAIICSPYQLPVLSSRPNFQIFDIN